MKEILESQLAIIANQYMLLDDSLLMDPNTDSSYELEYEYLRGKRDILKHLLAICQEEEENEWDDDYPCDIINDF
jgi:hypothetical protein